VDPLNTVAAEDDLRFQSGPWTGFFLQCWMPGRHRMKMELRFDSGRLRARGADVVGPFTFQGEYDPADGKCRWTKTYLGRHSISYSGINEGHGIWGVWELPQLGGLFKDRGVFHIWPQGMEPTDEANATVQAYVAHLRSRGMIKLVGLALLAGLAVCAPFLIRHLASLWTGIGVQ